MLDSLPRITLEQAFSVVVTLMKGEQAKARNLRQGLEWIASHECTADQYREMAKKFIKSSEEP